MGMFVLKCLLLEHEVVGEMMQHVIVHTWSWCRHSHHVRGWEHSLLLHSADLLLLWWNTVRINTLELTHSVCVERSDWRQDIFFWDRDIGQDWGIGTWDEPRHFGFGRDETRLRHCENVRDLRHCRDTGVKTWDEPKQLNGSVKEPNKFHNYKTQKITRKASDVAEYIELFGSRDVNTRVLGYPGPVWPTRVPTRVL